jgi:hypothetical protein
VTSISAFCANSAVSLCGFAQRGSLGVKIFLAVIGVLVLAFVDDLFHAMEARSELLHRSDGGPQFVKQLDRIDPVELQDLIASPSVSFPSLVADEQQNRFREQLSNQEGQPDGLARTRRGPGALRGNTSAESFLIAS